MNSVKDVAKYLSLCASVLAISGCVVINSLEPETAEVENSVDSVIAQDFVNIMVQIEELSPWSTVLQFGLEEGNPEEKDDRSIASDNDFGKALRAAAGMSGYEIETVDSPDGASNYVSFSIAEFGDAVDGTTYTYDVSIGDVDFRRVYKPLENGGVEPFKSMLVRGVDVSELVSDDSIFGNPGSDPTTLAEAPEKKPATSGFDSPVAKNDQLRNQPSEAAEALPGSGSDSSGSDSSEVSAVASSDNAGNVAANAADTIAKGAEAGTEVLDQPVAIAAPMIAEIPKANYEGTVDPLNASQPLVAGGYSRGFETIRKINIAESGESNYQSLLADKQDVAEEILIFGDDSYVLGARNKKILGNIMGKFDPSTDVVSVVGCSTGVTKIVNGNAALAIGRANRVKEALLYSGVPHDKIFDEGCWSPKANSTPFPNRGVVVTVKRNIKKG